jgi:hypothetical protein
MADNKKHKWNDAFLVLTICTALIVLLIWDQVDRAAPQTITMEPAVLVTPITEISTTTTVDHSPITVPVTTVPDPTDAFFACVRHRESHGDYTAVDPSGTFRGAYQIYQGGWDSIANSIGRTDLVGIQPDAASVIDQDVIAYAMFDQLGSRPWGGACQ